ncbi:MAG: (E)-4-hydroxy-3-methylbut-2-enyl-diphosphate synthase [Mucinivorans sp.]
MTTENTFSRRETLPVRIGRVTIGSGYPIAVQSMTTTRTEDTEASVAQILRIVAAGGEIVRLTTQGRAQAENLRNIKAELLAQGCDVPLVADVHFNAQVALVAAPLVEKVRINPGNWGDKAVFRELIALCKQYGTAIRIGVNHGSLAPEITEKYGDTPQGMVRSAMEFMEIAAQENFDQLVLSFKSSNVRVMTQAYNLGVRQMDEMGFHYPLHLGLTEAGSGEDGRARSAVAIGSLLLDGLGDTIRVSLTEPPENEIPAAFSILQASRARITKTEIISCPGCGRTLYDLQTTTAQIKERLGSRAGLKLAVMGCIVNGPGEMADADFGYVGAGAGLVTLYRHGVVVQKNIPQSQALDALERLIDQEL